MNRRPEAPVRRERVKVGASAKIPLLARRTCILILGMHRSGTSAITRVLNLLGAELPRHMVGPGSGNELGHWEPERLVALHDRMLEEANSHYDDWISITPGSLPEARLGYYKDQIRRVLIEEYGDASLFLIKDPRICRFVWLYDEILESMRVSRSYLLPIRHPLAVLDSLEARNNMSRSFSALFWLRHVLDAEAATRGQRRAIISYEALIDDPRKALEKIRDGLGLEWPDVNEKTVASARSFLSRSLMHHEYSRDDLEASSEASPWVKAAFEGLLALEADPADASAQVSLDAVRASLTSAEPLFSVSAFPRVTTQLETKNHQIAELRSAVELSQKVVDERGSRIAELEAELRKTSEENTASAAALHSMSDQVGRLDQRRTEWETRLRIAESCVSELQASLAASQNVVDARGVRIAELESFLSVANASAARATLAEGELIQLRSAAANVQNVVDARGTRIVELEGLLAKAQAEAARAAGAEGELVQTRNSLLFAQRVLEERGKRIAQLEASLAADALAAGKLSSTRQAELGELQRRLERTEHELAHSRTALGQKKVELEAVQETRALQVQALAGTVQRMSQVEAQLAAARAESEALARSEQEARAQQEQALARSAQRVSDLEADLAAVRAESEALSRSEQETRAQQEQASARSAQRVSDLEAALAAARAESAALVAAARAEHEALAAAARAESEALVAAARAEHEALAVLARAESEALNRSKQENEKLAHALDTVLASTSWRLTRPVRELKRTLNRVRYSGLSLPLTLSLQALRTRSRAPLANLRSLPLIRTSGLFDAAWYCARYSDVAASRTDPAIHYLIYGAAEDRDPGPEFSTAQYRASNPDIAASGINPLAHYLLYGVKEGRALQRSRLAISRDGMAEGLREGQKNGPGNSLNQPRALQLNAAARLIAFYLPQFHPIPENDSFWGKGFTEWTNVTRARPQFEGHYQPRLPGELGFYDLRVEDIQRRQVELAKTYGIGGFCFYFYWFNGRRVLEMPLEQYLNRTDADLPFCLCWANENWTRAWDGEETNVLIEQKSSADDDIDFISYVSRYLRDPRYIRVSGKPVLIVYRPSLLPDMASTATRWRQWCRENGIGEIYLCYVQSFEAVDPTVYNLDAAIEFPPNNMGPPAYTDPLNLINSDFSGKLYDWTYFVERSRNYPAPDYKLFRGICPSWDNEARRPGRGTVLMGSSPEAYREWLHNAVSDTRARFDDPSEQLVFINAWNEWAEGAYLEPDQKYGYAYLEATRDAVGDAYLLGQPTSEPNHSLLKLHEGRNFDPGATSLCPRLASPGSQDGSARPIIPPADTNEKSLQSDPIDEIPGVVIVGHDAAPHGAQFLALSLFTEYVQKIGVRVACLLLRGGPLVESYRSVGEVHELHGAAPDDRNVRDLLADLRQRRFATAICNTTVSGRFVEVLKSNGFSVISLVHELPEVLEAYEGRGLREEAGKIAVHADTVVFAGQLIADGFSRFAEPPPEKTALRVQGLYKPNRFRTASEIAGARKSLRQKLGLSQRTRIVLSVAFGDRRKGVDLFVEIANQLRHQKDVAFVWVGALESTIEGRVRGSVHVKSSVHFVGFTEDTHEYFAGADTYALTSREDPFPSVILEALDAGLPVIAFSGVGAFEQMLLENGVGAIVPAFNLREFARQLKLVLSNAAHRDALTARARDLTREVFSFRKYAYDLLQFAPNAPKRISVIVPNYNYARYLEQRLSSVVNQTVAPYEIIVLDDASTDGSREWLLERLPKIAPEALLIQRVENSGSAFDQWLSGVQASSGDLVWIAEADDFCHDDFLAETVPAFADPDVVLSYCQSRQVDEAGKVLCEHYLDYVSDISDTKWKFSHVNDGLEEIRSTLSIRNTIPNVSAVVFRRETLLSALLELGTTLREFRIAGDWLTYIAVLTHGKIAFSQRPLNSHRRHPNSITVGGFDARLLQEIMRVQRRVQAQFDCNEDVAKRARLYAEELYKQFNLSSAEHPTIQHRPELWVD